MSLIVQKFGGTSVRDAKRIRNVAGIIAETYLAGNDVIVVLSAQGDTTDDLIAKAEEINPHASKREMDMLLSTGEQISVALCAMALEAMGLPCISLAAWQVGIQSTSVHSDARIKKIDTERIQSELDQHRIVIVTGFQGVDRNGDVTTLGRGGSDTSAVALAAAFRADLCQIYTDVDGVYTTDPRIVPSARKLDEITYDEMLELASQGGPGAPQPQRGAGQEVQSEFGSRVQPGAQARHESQGGHQSGENQYRRCRQGHQHRPRRPDRSAAQPRRCLPGL